MKILLGTFLWFALVVALIVAGSGCSSVPQRTISEQSPECVYGGFEARSPLRPVSLQEAIEVCEDFCGSKGKVATDTYWIKKGQRVECACNCRKTYEPRGPKE